ARFEQVYGPDGDWVRLFRKARGHHSTRLLRDEAAPGRYLTVDEWESRSAFDAFRARFSGAFEALDERCASLTSTEELIGHFEGVEEMRSEKERG
ncbi:MAG TPA: antibiotic biosynthesis monooxygenase, partial [Gemmatimonadota bacterium]|nr:antibiotic biosynthesis monooxygenase [Gemmatimonadota bacterium]